MVNWKQWLNKASNFKLVKHGQIYHRKQINSSKLYFQNKYHPKIDVTSSKLKYFLYSLVPKSIAFLAYSDA